MIYTIKPKDTEQQYSGIGQKVWKTPLDAIINKPKDYEVCGVIADWSETIPSGTPHTNMLLNNNKLVSLYE